MADRFLQLGGKPALVCAADGPLLGGESGADDFLSLALSANAELLVLPVRRIDGKFFDLRSGIAGRVVQKFVTYGVRLVIMGDISEWTGRSRAFRDFVYEANKGGAFWFVADEVALRERLERA
ncbi:MAG: DUF4180 domain-containing protein [Parvibaculum sp.]